MAKLVTTEFDLSIAEDFLKRHKLTHLRASKRADTLTLAAGSADDPWPRARLRLITKQRWTLDVADAAGRWERTSFQAILKEPIPSPGSSRICNPPADGDAATVPGQPPPAVDPRRGPFLQIVASGSARRSDPAQMAAAKRTTITLARDYSEVAAQLWVYDRSAVVWPCRATRQPVLPTTPPPPHASNSIGIPDTSSSQSTQGADLTVAAALQYFW